MTLQHLKEFKKKYNNKDTELKRLINWDCFLNQNELSNFFEEINLLEIEKVIFFINTIFSEQVTLTNLNLFFFQKFLDKIKDSSNSIESSIVTTFFEKFLSSGVDLIIERTPYELTKNGIISFRSSKFSSDNQMDNLAITNIKKNLAKIISTTPNYLQILVTLAISKKDIPNLVLKEILENEAASIITQKFIPLETKIDQKDNIFLQLITSKNQNNICELAAKNLGSDAATIKNFIIANFWQLTGVIDLQKVQEKITSLKEEGNFEEAHRLDNTRYAFETVVRIGIDNDFLQFSDIKFIGDLADESAS